MSRRRLRRTTEKARRHSPPARTAVAPLFIVREATRVERLAYTRTQAAEALGVSRSTFDRRILPLVETVEMPWGARLIPVDELQRLIAERRRLKRGSGQVRAAGAGPRLRPASSVGSGPSTPPEGVWLRSHAGSTLIRCRRRTVA